METKEGYWCQAVLIILFYFVLFARSFKHHYFLLIFNFLEKIVLKDWN